jgi:hypothetical protein
VTVGAVMFLIGLGVGFIAQEVWKTAMELLDLYREERS